MSEKENKPDCSKCGRKNGKDCSLAVCPNRKVVTAAVPDESEMVFGQNGCSYRRPARYPD
ncbi:hypothetical protein [Burkholderia phage BCSR52]|uniref:Uncharacterized protein n=1 Tax=Burkholderia phage BCSR52 TaxID=2805748 RepID=A0A889IRJ7_9CAUD|nr:hypothetical protein [Burkholderia phage BCSR52]